MDRVKVAPWETYADGAWHVVRDEPAGEYFGESLRQYERYYTSARSWAGRNRFRVQISRRGNGRFIKVRFTKDEER